MIKKSIFIILIAVCYHLVEAHPIKLSTAKLDLTTPTPTLTINLFWDDFEAHLLKIYRQQLNVEQPDSLTKKVFYDYLTKRIVITQNGTTLTLYLQSIQVNTENTVSVVFIIPNYNTLIKSEIINTVLFDAFTNQSNVLHVISEKNNRNVYQFNKDKRSEIIK